MNGEMRKQIVYKPSAKNAVFFITPPAISVSIITSAAAAPAASPPAPAAGLGVSAGAVGELPAGRRVDGALLLGRGLGGGGVGGGAAGRRLHRIAFSFSRLRRFRSRTPRQRDGWRV